MIYWKVTNEHKHDSKVLHELIENIVKQNSKTRDNTSNNYSNPILENVRACLVISSFQTHCYYYQSLFTFNVIQAWGKKLSDTIISEYLHNDYGKR